MDKMHVVKEATLTVEKTSLILVLPCQLKKSLKNIHNCCKLQIVFKNKTRLGSSFHFNDRIPKDLTSVIFISFSVDSAMSPIMINV